MIKYIFEDKSTDMLSHLFQASYSAEYIDNHFIYANGNGKIVQCLENELTDSHGCDDYIFIFIFIDLVPDNRETAKVYNKLLRRQRNNHRIVIIPIPCAEYSVIKLLLHMKLVGVDSDTENIINRGTIYRSSIIESDKDKEFVKNFEKLCKLTLNRVSPNCAINDKYIRKDGHDTFNIEFGAFYMLDCICKFHKDWCNSRTLIEKSRLLLSMYKCFPSGSNIKDTKSLDYETIYKIHCELVDEYNDSVRKYMIDNPSGHYTIIGYMHNWSTH